MRQLIFLDIAPDPASTGLLLAVVLLVISLIALLAAGLVLFLWYRKRSLRRVPMVRSEVLAMGGADEIQASSPNHP